MAEPAAAAASSSSSSVGTGALVRLEASDGEIIELDAAAAKLSGLLAEVIETSGTADVIPVRRVRADTLRRVARYCEMHRDNIPDEIEKPLRSTHLEDLVSKEDFEFLEALDKEALFEVLLAANFLNVRPLIDLMGAKIASLIKHKTVEQLRECFGIENDFTPEQEAQIREENRWCEDA